MKVAHAGVIVELLTGGVQLEQVGEGLFAVPHLIDSEVTNALRNLVRRGSLTENDAATAMNGFLRLHLNRFAVHHLRPRMWELRHNLSAYDVTYVALAEALDAPALVTTDARLAAAPGVACRIELV